MRSNSLGVQGKCYEGYYFRVKIELSKFVGNLATLLLVPAIFLSACAQAPISQLLRDVQISPNFQETTPTQITVSTETVTAEPTGEGVLPVIVPADPSFHATDPASVSLANGRIQLIEFFAYWCSVCKAIAPTVHGIENLYGDQVEFIYLDRDDPATQSLQQTLGYIYQPHFFLLDEDGKVLGEWRGYVEGSTLQMALVEAIK